MVPDSARASLRELALSRLDPGAQADALASPSTIVENFLLTSPAYTNVILRTRYTEDALKAAVSRGIRQYVIIGAGFDSFALRRPDFAAALDIFEIDHPATQTMKTRRIAECGITLPDSVHFIAADLADRSVAEALLGSPYRADVPAFFSWLGVTMYLTQQSNFAVLRSIASCSGAGSELAFTYLDEKIYASPSESFADLSKSVAALGEPFQSGFNPATLDAELRGCGLRLIEDLNNVEVAARYARAELMDGGATRYSHIALARRLSNRHHE